MTTPEADVLPVGHRARLAVTATLWVTLGTAAAFTAFAYATTQVSAVRAGSPWQNDPYDGVVSFTEILVPALTLLILARMTLYRRHTPQPLFRTSQLLRAELVSTVLVAATVVTVVTVVTDWIAVALRADRPLWNSGTPWLIAALLPLTVMSAASLLLHRQAISLLPAHTRSPDGDWLDELAIPARTLAARLPGATGRLATHLTSAGSIGFVQTHIVAIAAAGSLTVSLLITTAQAIGEHWTSPLLFCTGAATGTGGLFAFCMISNTALRIAVPHPTTETSRRRSRTRHAARIATVVAALALPTAAVFRDVIWAALGRGQVDSPAEGATVTFTGGLLAAALAFCLAFTLARSTAR